MSSLNAPPRCARIANAAPPRQRQRSATSLGLRRRVHGDRVVGERLPQLGRDAARLRLGAVGLGDDHERRVGRKPERIRVAGVGERDAVEVLDRGRDDARREDALDRGDAGVGVAVEADHRQLELRRRDEPQPGRGDEAERPFGADEQALQVVAGDVLADRAAERDDLAGRDHRLDPGHPVAGDAVLERVRPAGVAGDVAADLD